MKNLYCKYVEFHIFDNIILCKYFILIGQSRTPVPTGEIKLPYENQLFPLLVCGRENEAELVRLNTAGTNPRVGVMRFRRRTPASI